MLRPVISCLFEYWHVPWGRGNDKYPPICFNVKNHFHNNNNNNQISCFITFFKSIIVFCGTGDILQNIPHIPHICIPMFLSLIHHMLSLEHKILRVNVSRREAFLAPLVAAVPTGIFTSSKEPLKLLMSRMWTGFELQHFHSTVLCYAV